MSEWHIIKGANDILICGPGNLIISLREFDRKKVEVIDKDVMGKTTLVSRVRYPLDNKISLELTILSSGSHTQIKLHVGDRIQWTIPEDFANALKSILTEAPVYSQTNVKKSTGTLKAKRRGPAKPKHQKISGRALELQKTKAELPAKAEKTPKANKKNKNAVKGAPVPAAAAAKPLKVKADKTVKAASTATTKVPKGKPGRPPKKADAVPQGVLVDNVVPAKSSKPVGRPPKKAKPVAQAILVNNVVMPKPSKSVGRPPKAAKPLADKPADKKVGAKPAKVVKAKPQSKPKKAK